MHSLGPNKVQYIFNTIFVSSHMYPENPEETQVIVGFMNMGYISDTARNRTHNLFRPKCAPIPLGHSDGHTQGIYVCFSFFALQRRIVGTMANCDLSVPLDSSQFTAVRCGGLGIRSVDLLAPSAFLASAAFSSPPCYRPISRLTRS